MDVTSILGIFVVGMVFGVALTVAVAARPVAGMFAELRATHEAELERLALISGWGSFQNPQARPVEREDTPEEIAERRASESLEQVITDAADYLVQAYREHGRELTESAAREQATRMVMGQPPIVTVP